MACPSLARNFLPSPKEGAGNAGCALHPRSRVQCAREVRTRAYRFSGNTPAFPAQWLYGLCRALPGDEFVFVTVIGELTTYPRPVGPTCLRRFDTSNGCQDHTILPYAAPVFANRLHPKSDFGESRRLNRVWRRSSARRLIAHERFALRSPLRADAAASTASHPAFVTIMIRPSCRVRRAEL